MTDRSPRHWPTEYPFRNWPALNGAIFVIFFAGVGFVISQVSIWFFDLH